MPSAISVNMFRLRFTTDAQPLWKNGQPPQSTTGVASPNESQSNVRVPSRCFSGSAGSREETMINRVGKVNDRLIQNRRVMFANSGLVSSAVTSRGSSAMPQIGQDPGSERTICGCMGHV